MRQEYRADYKRVEKAINDCIPRHIQTFNEKGKTLDEKIINFTTVEEVWAELKEMAKTNGDVFRRISAAEWYVIEAVSHTVKRKGIKLYRSKARGDSLLKLLKIKERDI